MRTGGKLARLGLVLAVLAAVPATVAQGSDEELGDADYAVEPATGVWVSWDHKPDEDGDKGPIDEARSVDADGSAGLIVGNDRSEAIRNVTLVFPETQAEIDVEFGVTRAGAASPDRAAFWPRIATGDFGPVIASLELGPEVEQAELTALVVFETADGNRHVATDTLDLRREDPQRASAPGIGNVAGLVLAVATIAARRPS